MDNVYSGYSSRPTRETSEDDLTPEQVQKYFKMLREVEYGYKGKPIIPSTVPMERDQFYNLFLSQTNREN